jgi:hypothetical protein
MPRKALISLWAFIPLVVSGCLMPIGVAYPTISSTPSVPIADDAIKTTHAFRVDFVELRKRSSTTEVDLCRFEEIDLSSRKEVPRQTAFGFAYNYALYSLPGNGDRYMDRQQSLDRWVHVRLYRPGFTTIEIGPDRSRKEPLVWAPATDDQARAEALDRLIGVEKNSLRHLEPGSVSTAHEAFLRFAANEYEALARSIKEENLDQAALRTRLQGCASKLRELAMN